MVTTGSYLGWLDFVLLKTLVYGIVKDIMSLWQVLGLGGVSLVNGAIAYLAHLTQS
jgi:hypothetical protein